MHVQRIRGKGRRYVWGTCLSDFLLLETEPGCQGCWPQRMFPNGLDEAGGSQSSWASFLSKPHFMKSSKTFFLNCLKFWILWVVVRTLIEFKLDWRFVLFFRICRPLITEKSKVRAQLQAPFDPDFPTMSSGITLFPPLGSAFPGSGRLYPGSGPGCSEVSSWLNNSKGKRVFPFSMVSSKCPASNVY